MNRVMLAPLVALGLSAACDAPRAVSPPSAALVRAPSSAWASDNDEPNFNLEVILRAPDGADGFGHVKFRQANDDEKRIDLGVWVRDLEPNTHYRLQRAVDTVVDDDCTSAGWLTLGDGAVAHDVVTDDRGTSKEDLFRVLPNPVGSAFDIHFRLVTTAGVPVLTSECYQFFVR